MACSGQRLRKPQQMKTGGDLAAPARCFLPLCSGGLRGAAADTLVPGGKEAAARSCSVSRAPSLASVDVLLR